VALARYYLAVGIATGADSNREALQNLIHCVPKQAAASSSAAAFAVERKKKHLMTPWNANFHHFDWMGRRKMTSCLGVAAAAAVVAAAEEVVVAVEQRLAALRASHSSLDPLTRLVL
jgi:hypothetical protein